MSRMSATACLLFLIAVCSADALAKKNLVRQLGGACGEDADIVATCDVGLTCKSGTCEMKSFLSAASASCRDHMKQAGVIGDRETVSVHDGFCYKNCSGLYELAIEATPVTERLMRQAKAGTQAFNDEIAKLSEADKASFKAAEDKCNSCGKQCTIGPGFLGRGGY